METGENKRISIKKHKPLPYVKAVRLIDDRGKMVETDDVKAFPRMAWKNMFNKVGNPILPNFNWRFVEEIPAPGVNDTLLPEKTGGSELSGYVKQNTNNTNSKQA
jgi:hypothetical protein